MTEHDVTKPYWGHNVSITLWDRENNRASGSCWLTPVPEEGDILIIAGKKGPIRLKMYNIRWVSSVDDMYHFDASARGRTYPRGVSPNAEDPSAILTIW